MKKCIWVVYDASGAWYYSGKLDRASARACVKSLRQDKPHRGPFCVAKYVLAEGAK